VLLAETLRSTTFRLALISIGLFGAVVIALFGYVYWSTTSFVLSRSDRAIEAERATLRNVYDTCHSRKLHPYGFARFSRISA
jgi:hypothetical protein